VTDWFDAKSALRTAWLGIAAAGLAGYLGIVAPAERNVRALLRQGDDLYQLANRNERMLVQEKALGELQERVRRDVRELAAENTPARAALALIELLEREGAQRNVSVGGFSPEEAAAAGDDAQRIALSVHGRYEDVVPFVGDLTRQRPLVEVEGVELSRRSEDAGGSEVDGRVRVVLYHTTAGIARSNAMEAHSHDALTHGS
jgi:Tfp pilus assembly protein PilO